MLAAPKVRPEAPRALPAPKRLTLTAEMIAEELITKWEGFREKSYQDTGGVWTIGYGTTKIAGQPVTAGMRVSHEQAAKFLRQDMQWAMAAVKDIERSLPRPLLPHEEGALISWTYNVGATAARNSASVTGRMKAGDFEGAANGLLKWVYDNGKVIQGLRNRREDERAVFLGRDLPPQFEEPTTDSSQHTHGSEPSPDNPDKPVTASSRFWAMIVTAITTIYTAFGEWIMGVLYSAHAATQDEGLIGILPLPVVGVIGVFALGWALLEHRRRYAKGEA